MGKVSIGLYGWRFDESELFTDDDEWRPLESMSADTRTRLLRLQTVIGKPCDACYLIHGEAEKRRCREAAVVYGEPMDEVVLCRDHERDFLFWFRERGGRSLAGQETFRDAFHEWFDDGGRAPDGYEGIEHVDESPGDLPEPPDPQEVYEREQELLADQRSAFDGDGGTDTPADATTNTPGSDGGSDTDDTNTLDADYLDADDPDTDDSDADDLDTDDLDLNREYPG
jgi:hypothetical protein